ncbi:hypothetical protein ACFFTN_23440, partial [Aminobacter aganoensis]
MRGQADEGHGTTERTDTSRNSRNVPICKKARREPGFSELLLAWRSELAAQWSMALTISSV